MYTCVCLKYNNLRRLKQVRGSAIYARRNGYGVNAKRTPYHKSMGMGTSSCIKSRASRTDGARLYSYYPLSMIIVQRWIFLTDTDIPPVRREPYVIFILQSVGFSFFFTRVHYNYYNTSACAHTKCTSSVEIFYIIIYDVRVGFRSEMYWTPQILGVSLCLC